MESSRRSATFRAVLGHHQIRVSAQGGGQSGKRQSRKGRQGILALKKPTCATLRRKWSSRDPAPGAHRPEGEIWGRRRCAFALGAAAAAVGRGGGPKQVTSSCLISGNPIRPQAPGQSATAAPGGDRGARVEGIKRNRGRGSQAYLIDTATPATRWFGRRAGRDRRLHPDLLVNWRPRCSSRGRPGWRMPGFFRPIGRPPSGSALRDKFNSLHSYGLAADMTGIGAPGSRLPSSGKTSCGGRALSALRADNRAEFNHTQLVPTKGWPEFLRHTITASEPQGPAPMWLASGNQLLFGRYGRKATWSRSG